MNMFRTSRIFRNYVKRIQLNNIAISLNSLQTRTYSSNNCLELKKEKSQILYQHLYSKILACGPITVADYMQEILTHPIAGYYMTKDVFGTKGDFITSPEICQLFGELISIWMIYEWKKICKDSFQIIELGPGRGTLVKDILRTFKQLKLLKKISIHLVEISPTLSSIQAEKLCTTVEEYDYRTDKTPENFSTYYKKGLTEDGVEIYWYYSVKDIPRKFSVFVAHEFFDALPIHKFQKTKEGWNEVLVDIIEGSKEEKFRYVLSKTSTNASKFYIADNEKRDHVEVSPESIVIVDYISKFLWECGGFALICDYGHNGDKTDTFRAFYKHKLHDPLSNPGLADLTADVDFSILKEIAEKDNRLVTFGPVTQESFLKNLGIDVRLKMLLKRATEEEKKQLESGYGMIMNNDKMGERFKFLSLFPFVLKEYFQKLPVAGFSVEEQHKT